MAAQIQYAILKCLAASGLEKNQHSLFNTNLGHIGICKYAVCLSNAHENRLCPGQVVITCILWIAGAEPELWPPMHSSGIMTLLLLPTHVCAGQSWHIS